MKVFDRVEGFESKVNFVDKYNVVLGYDLDTQCCEQAGYLFHKDLLPVDFKFYAPGAVEIKPTPDELEDYYFDTPFRVEVHDHDENNWVTFRLIKLGSGRKREDDIYLTIFNCHNGYYSHNFTFTARANSTEGYL